MGGRLWRLTGGGNYWALFVVGGLFRAFGGWAVSTGRVT